MTNKSQDKNKDKSLENFVEILFIFIFLNNGGNNKSF